MAIGLIILLQTFIICLIIGLITKTFWFSYILFLIFIGGILVLFIYVSSIASNEIFSISFKTIFISIILILRFLIIIIIIDKINYYPIINNNEINEIFNINSFLKENNLNLNKLYNFPTNLITILLINYLFVTLIAIVKITDIFFGPLRQIN